MTKNLYKDALPIYKEFEFISGSFFFHVFRKYIGQIYTDSLVHDSRALEYLVDVIGEDNVMLGTDYPFPLGDLDCGKLIESMTKFDDQLKVSFLFSL